MDQFPSYQFVENYSKKLYLMPFTFSFRKIMYLLPSCLLAINQHIFICNEILMGFVQYPTGETQAVFLDISKVFDKAYHEDLTSKLEFNGVRGKH